jgi:acetyltransferase-like isoleucine patch superfamily enzyme
MKNIETSDIKLLRSYVNQGLQVGKNCRIFSYNFGSEPYLIKMGDNVAISVNVQFSTHDGAIHVLRNLYKNPKIDILKPIIIKDNVYIGMNCTILPGTVIESNVIVGANSLVGGTLNANHLYMGNPCRKIKTIDKYWEDNKTYMQETKQLSYEEKKEFYLNKYKKELQ